ncbi:AAA family ATPase [Candidatus Synechococcus spongiarum]|uniref:ATPase AAA-type core domain-containing protein n=1 Tax=Candidatus Synechococcus spongiarum LMB bulk15N TaxID=1943583 RepID=A0A1T1D532_9SYNE|nr:ATP-binding protein [Candidatus Synechococcus spongiarum]OOV35969.1 hypothetical protein BV53_02440 [Candidatus Synechococcus spongiarum LMB bulk15N]
MLHRLRLKNTGPAPELALDPLAPRLNLITGDNGLGKSFLLDVAWYCLTRRWPQEVNPGLTSGAMALPRDPKRTAEINFCVDGEHRQQQDYNCRYEAEDEAWLGQRGRPVNPGLVLYAMADGGFAVWDSARNAWKQKGSIDEQDKIKAYVFSGREVWQGLPNSDPRMGWLCNGLVRDWANWQREGESSEPFQQLKTVLHALSPPAQPLQPDSLKRLRVSDTTDYPTIIGLGDSSPVPVVHGSSGVRRILALSYLLVWAWQEHQLASTLLGKDPARQVIFLIDEVEVHLHPSWQRRIVGSLLNVLSELNQATSVQMLLVTHSPLVMASVEPHFDPNRDRWWDLDLHPETRRVKLIQQNFTRLGDANSWLRSEAFDQDDTGSLEREKALKDARRLLNKDVAVAPTDVEAMRTRLTQVLGSVDPFWIQWDFESTLQQARQVIARGAAVEITEVQDMERRLRQVVSDTHPFWKRWCSYVAGQEGRSL